MSRCRNWTFTVNNYDDLVDPSLWPTQYCIFSEECSESGTPHLQGYLELTKALTLGQMKLLDGLEGAHLEPRIGSAESNVKYCSPCKKGEPGTVDPTHVAGPYEYGSRKQQGERTDLASVAAACVEGIALRDVAMGNPSAFIRYGSGIARFHSLVSTPRALDKGTVCFVFYGAGGCGKTSFALRLASYLGNVYKVPEPKGSGLYWDGYNQGDVVVLDEFKGSRMMPTFFNQMIDKGPFAVPIHGGSVQFNSEYVFITTNVHPRLWWPNIQFQHSLRRRITLFPIFRNLSFRAKKKAKVDGVSELMAYQKDFADLDL